jgi:hypothetical protein
MRPDYDHGIDRLACRWCPDPHAPSWNAIEKSLLNRLEVWVRAASREFFDLNCGMQAHYLFSHLYKYLPLDHEAKAVGINPEAVGLLAQHVIMHVRLLRVFKGSHNCCICARPVPGFTRQHISMKFVLARNGTAPIELKILKAFILRGDLIVRGDLARGEIGRDMSSSEFLSTAVPT